jgi:hypothetical protein
MGNWFSGSCVTDVDAGGSFYLPLFVEAALEKAEHRFGLIVESHPRLPCLVLKMGGSPAGSHSPGPQRMKLSAPLRTHAAIGRRMLAVSACGHVELWDPLLGSIFGDADVKLLCRFEQFMEADLSEGRHEARTRFGPRSFRPARHEESLWRQWTFN